MNETSEHVIRISREIDDISIKFDFDTGLHLWHRFGQQLHPVSELSEPLKILDYFN